MFCHVVPCIAMQFAAEHLSGAKFLHGMSSDACGHAGKRQDRLPEFDFVH